MIMAGDKIKIIKDMGIIGEGTILDVTEVLPNGTILVSTSYGIGCMTADELGVVAIKYEAPQTREWTKWKWSHNDLCDFGYRTNGKSVQVELWNGVRGRSSCHPDDTFDLDAGIYLALARAAVKFANAVERELNHRYANLYL